MSNLCNSGATWSRGKWWLWAILGLLALYLLMLWFKWDPIEKDIQSRTNAALSASGQSWAVANLEMRGRDVLLSGEAPSEAAKQQAINTAKAVYGVRTVDSDFGLKQYRNPAFSMAETGNGVVLSGELAHQSSVDQVVASASGLYGAANVDNQLTISDDISPAAWIGGVESALKSTHAANDATLSISDSSAVLAGMVRSEDDKSSVFNLVRAALNDSLGDKIDNQLTVKPYEPASVMAERVGGRVTLKGTVQSQQTADQIAQAAIDVVGANNVDNQLRVSVDTAAVTWGGGIASLMDGLPDPGSLSANNGQVRVVGEVADDGAKASLLDKVASLFNGLALVDEITVKPVPLSPASVSVNRAGERFVLRGTVQSQATSDRLGQAAAAVVGADNVNNGIVVSEGTAPFSSLGGLARMMGALPDPGGLAAGNGEITISGEVPSEGAKSSLLTRISAQFGGVTLIDNVRVVAPPPTPVVEPKPVVSALDICQGRLNDAMEGKKIEFATNSATINFQSYPLLASIIRVLSDCQSYLSTTTVEVSGHTDDQGSDSYNQDLSAARATSVVEYLTAAGVKTSLLRAVGYGESSPIASNETQDGRAKNRRIQFDIKQ